MIFFGAFFLLLAALALSLFPALHSTDVFQPDFGGRAVEHRQSCLSLVGQRFCWEGLPVGVHWRQAVRGVVVIQREVDQLAGFLVLIHGLDRLLRGAVGKAELPAADITEADGDHGQALAAGCLATLTRQDQQLVVRDLGSAVVIPGKPGDEVEISPRHAAEEHELYLSLVCFQ